MNAPDPFQLLFLNANEEKVAITEDSRVPNAAVYVLKLEDHTMGNAIRTFVILSK